MEYFSLCLDGFNLAGQGVLHIAFAGRLTGKKRRPWHFAAYVLSLCAIELISRRLALGGVLPLGWGVLALYGMTRFGLGNGRPVSWLAAVLAFYISQLSFGVINSVQAVAFPRLIGSPLLYPLLVAAQLVFFALCACCFAAVRRLLRWTEDSPARYIGLLLLPTLFFFAAQLYILHTAYRSIAASLPPEEAGRHGGLLLLQVMGLAAAGGISAQVSLLLPQPCGIDDLDLCVIFANALDNAISACRSGQGPQSIRVSGRRQGDFYMLTFENTCDHSPLPPAGTGLSNIRSVAEKYHGAVLAEKADRRFSLNVLLNIS